MRGQCLRSWLKHFNINHNQNLLPMSININRLPIRDHLIRNNYPRIGCMGDLFYVFRLELSLVSHSLLSVRDKQRSVVPLRFLCLEFLMIGWLLSHKCSFGVRPHTNMVIYYTGVSQRPVWPLYPSMKPATVQFELPNVKSSTAIVNALTLNRNTRHPQSPTQYHRSVD